VCNIRIYIPNVITTLRIFGTASLLFIKPLSIWFYIVYVFSGLTDILDGYIARKFNFISKLGQKLDSAADLIFYSVVIIRILPILIKELPHEIWFAVAFILLVRFIIYMVSAIKYHSFISTHSVINKITSFCVFAIPFLIRLPMVGVTFWTISVFGILGSMHELLHVVKYVK